MTAQRAGRVPNEWYRKQYDKWVNETVAKAPPLTVEAQQLVRRLMGAPAAPVTEQQPAKKVRRVCRQAQTLRAYRRYQAGA